MLWLRLGLPKTEDVGYGILHLSPQVRNVTRWTSTLNMPIRYRELYPFLIQRETGLDAPLKQKFGQHLSWIQLIIYSPR